MKEKVVCRNHAECVQAVKKFGNETGTNFSVTYISDGVVEYCFDTETSGNARVYGNLKVYLDTEK